MTIWELISNSTFEQKYILEKLICGYLSFSREQLRSNSDFLIKEDVFNKIKEGYNNHVNKNMPMEYVLGYVEFFNRKFYVNNNTLIPRPETEYMILAINEFLDKIDKKNILLDIGTGCGVLGLSVLLDNYNKISKCIFTDICDGALEVAKKNFDFFSKENNNIDQINVKFIKSNLIEFLFDQSYLVVDNVVLVANLPYIPDQTFDDNSPANVKEWEPRFAFIGGEDGLDLYREMFQQILSLDNQKRLDSKHFFMFLEMMTWQVDILKKEFSNFFVFEEVKTFHFNIRIVKAFFAKK